MRDLVEARLVEAAALERPELGGERARRRLQQGREEDVVGAEAHAVAAEVGAPVLIEAAHLVGDLGPFQHAERLDHLIADAAGEPGEVGGRLDLHQRPEQAHDMRPQPRGQPRLDLLAGRAGEAVIGDEAQARLEQLVARRQLGDRIAGPADDAVVREHQRGVGRRGEAVGPRLDLAGQRLLRGGAQGLGFVALGLGVGHELEAVKTAHMLTLDGDVTAGGDFGFQHRLLSQAPHQDAGAPVDEAAREALVQGVGQSVLYPTRLALPMQRIEQPVGAVRHEGPGAPLGDALGQGVDVAVGAVDHRHVAGEPIVGDAARHAAHEEAVELRHEVGMGLRMDLAVVRHPAGVPQAPDRRRPLRHVADVVLAHQDFEGLLVLAHGGAGQALLVRMLVEARLQLFQRGEIEIGIAPLQHAHGLEIVRLQRLDHLRLEGRAASCRTECAVGGVAAGAPGDLAHLGGRQLAEAGAVVFPVGGKGHVVDVEVEPHADRVGGDEVVDLAGLVELDLRIAGAGRERAEHHRRPAALAPDQFGDGVDLFRREGDDRRAVRQPRDLFFTREGQAREAGPRRRLHAGDQRLHQRQHGRGADQQRLLAPAPVEQAVGEDVAAVHVGGELDLVDGHERHVEVPRHRLDGADPVARPVRLDLLLAGDEGDVLDANLGDDAQIDLAGQEPQRQADHAGRMQQHPLDRHVGLARIRRAEHRRDAARAGLAVKGTERHAEGGDPCGAEGRRRSGGQPGVWALRRRTAASGTGGNAAAFPHMGRRRPARQPGRRGWDRRRCRSAAAAAAASDRCRACRASPSAGRGGAGGPRSPGPRRRRRGRNRGRSREARRLVLWAQRSAAG